MGCAEEREKGKLGLLEAIALNTLNMFGTGPFVSLPLLIGAVDPPGAQALIGYTVAWVACVCDSFVWAELGSMFPQGGGTYVYLKKCYGAAGPGRLMSFLFVWQQVISGPMEIATGYTAIAQYATYIVPLSYVQRSLLSSGLAVATVALLYRDTKTIGSLTLALWVGTIAAICLTIGFGTANGEIDRLYQPGIVVGSSTFLWSVSAAMKFSIYDLMGYYDVCYVADQVSHPTRNVPIACIATCVVVGLIFLCVDSSIISAMQWQGEDGLLRKIEDRDPSTSYLMSLFAEQHMGGRVPAVLFTLLVVYTIFGSSFSLLYGYAQIPYAAAKDGEFFAIFAHTHPQYSGLCDWSLLFTGSLSVVFCWFDLETIIAGLITTRVLIQFIGQTIGLMYHRGLGLSAQHRSGAAKGHYTMPLYPLPCLVQLALFAFIFVTSDSAILGTGSGLPIVEGALLVLLSGAVAYFGIAWQTHTWPFAASPEQGGAGVGVAYGGSLLSAPRVGRKYSVSPDTELASSVLESESRCLHKTAQRNGHHHV